MRNSILIFLFHLFCLVCCIACRTLEQKVDPSLETVLWPTGQDTDSLDEEWLASALSCLPAKEDASAQGRLWYHWGLIAYCREAYDQAIVSFEKALRQAWMAGDRHLEGLVWRAMADTYHQTYNIREDTVYLRRALRAFDAAEDSLLRTEAALRLAGACMKAREWTRAEGLLQEFLPVCVRNPPLYGLGMAVAASYLLNAPSADPERALRCYMDAEAAGFALDDDHLSDFGYALYLTGRKERAIRLWDSLDGLHPEGLIRLQYRLYDRYRLEGRTGMALTQLERIAVRQDSLLRAPASGPVMRAQRDYQESVAESERLAARHERERRRIVGAVSALVAVLLVLAGFALWLDGRERLETVRQALEESERMARRLSEAGRRHTNKIESLKRTNRNREAVLKEIRSNYMEMLRDGYRRLGRLFEDKRFAETQVMTEVVLYQKVCEMLKEIDGDDKGFQRLRDYIEDHLGHPVASLQEDIPSLSERDIRLFCYLVIGYDAPLIAALMGAGKDRTIHDWKNRLVTKIRRLPLSKARQYLDLIR